MKTIIRGVVPSKSNGYGIARNRMYKKKLTLLFEKAFEDQCKYNGELIESEHAIHLVVYYDSKRPDLDGSFKVTMDCLQKCNVIKNDNRTVIILAQKLIDKKDPRVEIEIVPLFGYDYGQLTTRLSQVIDNKG